MKTLLDQRLLPEREALILRRFEQLSWKEVGERLERSADACRMLATPRKDGPELLAFLRQISAEIPKTLIC